MCRNTFLICVYYFSLPEFPDHCDIVKNNSLFVRDILVSNPINPHIRFGGQYDPHYEHSFAPQFKICKKNVRRKIMSIVENELYEKIYILFRTNKVSLGKKTSQHISGYYDVDMDNVAIDPNYDEPVIYAKEARFTNQENAVNLSDFLNKTGYYRVDFSSETKNGAYEKSLYRWMKKIRSTKNLLTDYVKVTNNLNGLLKYYEYEEGIYPMCSNCADADKCYLIKRIKKKEKLYHQLPKDIAKRINKYYKKAFSTL